MRILLSIVFLGSTFLTSAQLLDIKILSNYHTKNVTISHKTGSYSAWTDTIKTGTILTGESFQVKIKDNRVALYEDGQYKRSADTIWIQSRKKESVFRIKMNDQRIRERIYQGNLKIYNEKGFLKIINTIDLNRYLAGVIETEGGAHKHLEYYKVQAILSRTFALGHRNRHTKEGFNLCDDVHCQAYKNMLRYTPEIEKAVESTSDIIMIDTNNHIIDGFFSANCGGQSCETDWVWNQKLHYLQSVKDTFCIHTRQSTWEKKIGQWEWKSHLVKKYGFPVDDPRYKKYLYSFDQKERQIFYGPTELGIPLSELRSHFRLKSTFFSVEISGDYVLLKGRGFGHGIGMCQEGAMNMAEKGYKYEEIIHFYFRPVELIDYQWYIYISWPEG